MAGHMPATKAALLKMIATHTAKAQDPKAMASQVCGVLEKRKQVLVAPDGKKVTYHITLAIAPKKPKQPQAVKKGVVKKKV